MLMANSIYGCYPEELDCWSSQLPGGYDGIHHLSNSALQNSLVFDAEVVPAHWILNRAPLQPLSITALILPVHLLTPRYPGTPVLHLLRVEGFFLSFGSPHCLGLLKSTSMAGEGCQRWCGLCYSQSGCQDFGCGGIPPIRAICPRSRALCYLKRYYCTWQDLWADRIVLKGDSATIISWIQVKTKHLEAYLIFHNIQSFLSLPIVVIIWHVLREANSVADWVASFFVDHIDDWSWCHSDVCLPGLQDILYADHLGCSHMRLV